MKLTSIGILVSAIAAAPATLVTCAATVAVPTIEKQIQQREKKIMEQSIVKSAQESANRKIKQCTKEGSICVQLNTSDEKSMLRPFDVFNVVTCRNEALSCLNEPLPNPKQ